MLDNIGGYSVDKAKFWIELTPTEEQNMRGAWEDVFGELRGPQGGMAYNITSVKKGTRLYAYWYAFDVWGEAASHIDRLNFATWYPYLDRIDLKLTMPMTQAGRDNYEDYLSEKLAGKRSVGKLTSPTRQKRGNRDAGGHTLTIGSHKSDFRVHWTLRGDELGYQEFQLQGTRIADSIMAAKMNIARPGTLQWGDTWLSCAKHVLVSAQVELSNLDGLYDLDRAAILSGREDIHGIMENKLTYIEDYISRLPKSALFGLYDALQEKLFGLPPEAEIIAHELAADEGIEGEE